MRKDALIAEDASRNSISKPINVGQVDCWRRVVSVRRAASTGLDSVFEFAKFARNSEIAFVTVLIFVRSSIV